MIPKNGAIYFGAQMKGWLKTSAYAHVKCNVFDDKSSMSVKMTISLSTPHIPYGLTKKSRLHLSQKYNLRMRILSI